MPSTVISLSAKIEFKLCAWHISVHIVDCLPVYSVYIIRLYIVSWQCLNLHCRLVWNPQYLMVEIVFLALFYWCAWWAWKVDDQAALKQKARSRWAGPAQNYSPAITEQCLLVRVLSDLIPTCSGVNARVGNDNLSKIKSGAAVALHRLPGCCSIKELFYRKFSFLLDFNLFFFWYRRFILLMEYMLCGWWL